VYVIVVLEDREVKIKIEGGEMKSQRIYGVGSGNFFKENKNRCIVEVLERTRFNFHQCRNNKIGYGENEDLCVKHSKMEKTKLYIPPIKICDGNGNWGKG